MCALVLSEGRSKGQELGDALLPLQRRYTAPLMDLLARGQHTGAIRADVPLRLLRPMVFGPMEHILWEVVATGKPIDIEATAASLCVQCPPSIYKPTRGSCDKFGPVKV